MAKKAGSYVTIVKKQWELGQDARETLKDISEFIKSDKQEVPKNLQRYLQKEKKERIRVSIYCVSCGVTNKLILYTNKKNDVKKGLCPHTVFHLSEII